MGLLASCIKWTTMVMTTLLVIVVAAISINTIPIVAEDLTAQTVTTSSLTTSKVEYLDARIWNSSFVTTYPIRTISFIRTTNADHYTIDEVMFTSGDIVEMIASALLEQARQINIRIPDTIDEVEQISVTIPLKLVENLRLAHIDFVIETDHGMMRIPYPSLEGIDTDVWFRLTVTKDPNEIIISQEITRNSNVVVDFAGKLNKSTIVGRPWNVSTNIQESLVDWYIPTRDHTWNKRQLQKLKVYMIHLNGTIELVDGDIVKTKDYTYIHIYTEQVVSLTLILVENKYHGMWWALAIIFTMMLMFIVISERIRRERYVRKELPI